MKRFATIFLAFALLFSMTGCSLFSSDSVVKLGDYSYSDPKGIQYDERIVLSNENFGASLEDAMNAAAYPSNLVYDEKGDIVGLYDYDAETGLAKGWTSLTDGTYTAYAAGEEVDLGMPDEALMISLAGNVALYWVVYGKDSTANDAWLYVMLTDKADQEAVISAMEQVCEVHLTAESDTVLKAEMDADAISEQFDTMEEFGNTVDSRDAQAFASVLMMNYGVRTYGDTSAYTPYDGHEDPADLEFDQRVVLVGSAEMAVDEGYADDVTSMTTYVYGSQGNAVAQYTYYECPSKEAADELMGVASEFFFHPVRVSDTVIQDSLVGQEMKDAVSAYIGYSVLKDESVDAYVQMIEETYYSVVCSE